MNQAPNSSNQAPAFTVREGLLALEISADSMRATVELLPGYAGGPEALQEALAKHQVAYGVDQASLKELLEQARKTSKTVRRVVACGAAPRDAEDGRIDFKFSIHPHSSTDADTDKNVDFRETGKIIPAKTDQLLAVLIPSKESVMGTDVHGKAVLANKRRGTPPVLKPGRNVRLDDNEYFATCDGLVQFTGREIQVLEEYNVANDVDFSIGNIRFAGNVTVQGNVLPGFSIEVGGHVKVFGEVNDARITAAGSITVQHGIVGTGKSEVRSGQDISAGFIENSLVESRGNVTIRSHAMHSRIYAEDTIKAATGKGAIIGGEARAGKGIQARIIGSESVQGTVLALGGGIEQDNQLREIRRQLHAARLNMQKIQLAIGDDNFKMIKDDPTYLRQLIIQTRRPILQKMMENHKKLQEDISQIEARKSDLQERIAAAQNGVIQAIQIAYQGSTIAIAHLTLELKEDIPAAVFRGDFTEGVIQHR